MMSPEPKRKRTYKRNPVVEPLRSRIIMPREVIRSFDINSDEKELYAVLALFTDASGAAFVQLRTLAEQCRCSTRYVQMMLKNLQRNQFVEWVLSAPANVYRLKFPP